MSKIKVAAILAAAMVLFVTACNKEDEQFDYITFEELEPDPDLGYWNGSDGGTGFESGNGIFPTTFTDWGGGITSWSGFAYSNNDDTSSPGFGNQFSCYAGGGDDGSEIFAVISVGDTITFKVPEQVNQISVANSTYTALSMRDGDQFAKKFGGDSGNDPDWFILSIEGIREDSSSAGIISVYLADYRSDNEAEDYISNAWTVLPMDGFGAIKKLAFSFESSDTGDWGMNTPAYACIDNISGVLR